MALSVTGDRDIAGSVTDHRGVEGSWEGRVSSVGGSAVAVSVGDAGVKVFTNVFMNGDGT